LAASVLTVFLPSETPSAVDEYLEGPGAGPLFRSFDSDLTAASYIIGALLFVFFTIYVASLIGLLLLKPWARRLYVFTFVVGACVFPFSGTSLVDPISGTVDYLGAVCSGAILATLFLSEVRIVFDVRTPNTSLERTHGR
jgi:hypothetical protein